MNKWIVGACLVCLLSACSKDGEEAPQSPDNPNTNERAEVRFSSNVRASVVVELDGPSPRAPLTSFENNAPVGIFGIPAIGGGNNDDCDLYNRKRKEDFQQNLFNARYTYVEGYEELQSEFLAVYPYGANPALMLYGYYPYSLEAKWLEVNGVAQWAIPWKLNTADMSQTTDYLYTGPMLAVYNKLGPNPILLNFQHAMGRLDFRFYSTSKQVCDAGYLVKSITVECNTGKSGWLAITDGEFAFDKTENLVCQYPISGYAGITYASPGAAAAKYMFPPEQTMIRKITCDMLDGGANLRTYTIYDYKYSGYDIPLKAGSTTEMRINFLPKDAALSPPNVNGWDKGTTMDVNVKLQ